MKKTKVEWLLVALVAIGITGCNKNGDDGASCGCDIMQDLTQYEDDVNGLLGRTFSGIIEDEGGGVLCRFAGGAFTMSVEVAPVSEWDCKGNGDEPPDGCTYASSAGIELGGTLEIEETYELNGSANLFGGSLTDMDAYLTAHIPVENHMGGGSWESLMFEDVFETIAWEIHNDEEGSLENMERCILNVDTIE